MLVQFDFKLISIKGVNIVMAAKLLAEIGDINRFASADRLAESEYNEFLLKENEEVIFSFSIAESDEVLALCVSKEEPSYIVYGFGTSENVELEFPEDLVDSWDRFTYSYYLPGGSRENEGLDLNYLTFEYDGTEYEIFQEYSSENDATDVGIKITDLTTFEETILKASKDSIRGDLIELRGNDKIKLEVQ